MAKVKAVCASLKMGNYRSPAAFLSSWRVESERRDQWLDDSMKRHLSDGLRSCRRGLGGPVRARPLPLDALHRFPFGEDPVSPHGPLNPRVAVSVGAWWLCREIELSTARARMIELARDASGCLVAKLHLPASKNDIEALGVGRSHACCCASLPPWREVNEGACPAHLIFEQMGFLKDRFPGRFTAEGLPDWELPLFPTAGGTVVGKEAMTRTIELSATALGVDLAAPDGSERISGHSLRVTGAQGLLAYGWHLWAIQLMGRWGSETIRKYLRESPLQYHPGVRSASSSSASLVTQDLGSLIAAVRNHPIDVCSGVGGRTHAGRPGRSGCGGGCGSFATALI